MTELKNIFTKSLQTIQKYWISLLTITFVTEGIVLFTKTYWTNFLSQQNFNIFGGFSDVVKAILGLMMISLLTPIGKSATAYLISKKQSKIYSGVTSYLAILKKLPLILAVSFIWFAGTFAGLGLFIIPGVIFFFGSQLTIQAMVVENLGILEAFKRGWQLVKQNIWAIIILFLVIEIGQGIMSSILAGIILAIIPKSNLYYLDWFVSTFAALFVYVPLAIMYLERREKEVSLTV